MRRLGGDILPSPDPEEVEQVYDDYNQFIVTIGASGNYLHLPEDDSENATSVDTVCDGNGPFGKTPGRENRARKPVEVYPPGYRPICSGCVFAWRHGPDASVHDLYGEEGRAND